MEAAVPTETLVQFYPPTWHNILGDRNFAFVIHGRIPLLTGKNKLLSKEYQQYILT